MGENLSSGFPTRPNTKPTCTVTDKGKKLEFLDLRRRRIVFSVREKHLSAAVQLHVLHSLSATLFLCMQKAIFLLMPLSLCGTNGTGIFTSKGNMKDQKQQIQDI